MSSRAAEHYTVALQGFSDFERGALSSFFRLAAERVPAYVQVDRIDRSDFIIADADHDASLQAVLATGRANDTVFVGARAPQGAMAWLARPIDPMHIVRELDSLVEQRNSAPGELRAALADVALQHAGAAAFGVFDGPGLKSGPEVLVVEDSAIARRFLGLRLSRFGYRVRLAIGGDEAMALLEREYFPLVFLDVVLGPPGSLDGLAICQHLKRHPPGAPRRAPKVVIVTGLGGAMDQVRGELAGCDAYLTKPVSEEALRQALHKLDPGFIAHDPESV
ncbi:response regulator [Piscinibacter sp.]|uniref:response regulator n=1 Tax=Piscinibacter sp. TaxID=1903157 RepID=UPI002C879F2F|nr:response regulator [Albitalea sp.]HUG25620.1 response regulator [Albitalea sp.]